MLNVGENVAREPWCDNVSFFRQNAQGGMYRKIFFVDFRAIHRVILSLSLSSKGYRVTFDVFEFFFFFFHINHALIECEA